MQSKIVYTLIKKVCEYRVMNYKETPLEKKYKNYNEYKNNNYVSNIARFRYINKY